MRDCFAREDTATRGCSALADGGVIPRLGKNVYGWIDAAVSSLKRPAAYVLRRVSISLTGGTMDIGLVHRTAGGISCEFISGLFLPEQPSSKRPAAAPPPETSLRVLLRVL